MMVMSCENYDPCYPDQPVVDLYLPIWATQPAFRSKPAFIWAEDSPKSTSWSSITYSQLNQSVDSIASHLLFPLQRGDTLLILCPPGLHLVKIIFACQRSGLVAIPIIPPDPSTFSSPGPAHHHLHRVIAQTNPKAAVAHPHYISTLLQYRSQNPNSSSSSSSSSAPGCLSHLLRKLRWLSVDDLDPDNQHNVVVVAADDTCSSSEYSGCQADETYLIQYTSGATGIPKPVVVTAGAAAHNVRVARKAYDLQPSSIIVSWLPQYHDCGLMFLLLTIVSGATCVLTSPSAFINRPRLWLELITEFKATCTPVPSFALPLVVKRGGVSHGKLPLKLGSMRNLVLINEPIYKSSVEEFVKEFECAGLNPCSISPSYGLAENCTFVSTAWHYNNNSGGSSSCSFPDMPSYKKLLPSARLSSGEEGGGGEEDMEIVVVNEETCEPVEDGVEGEIWVSSPSNASGYLSHPSLTREVFHGRLRGRASRCFLRTGDRGVVVGDDRYLYVVGRSSDVIRVDDVDDRRNPVHPHYIETAAYNSRPRDLRAGCIAAFGVGRPPEQAGQRSVRGEMVVVVAELVKINKEKGGGAGVVYRGICEEIRAGVTKEEGVGVGLVVLVESGSVPKTTSGKLRRWAAKEKLLGGTLPVVCEVRFEEGGDGGGGEARSVVDHPTHHDEELVSFAPTASVVGRRPSLLSFL